MHNKWQELASEFKQELTVYQAVLKDRRTPGHAKLLLWIAVGYLLMPLDLIPDFIPVLGQLDDLIIVPFLIVVAIKFIPKELVTEYRNNCIQKKPGHLTNNSNICTTCMR